MGKFLIPTPETWPGTADAVVIGGGIVGVSTAFWLSRAGMDTVLLEMRGDLGGLTSSKSIECYPRSVHRAGIVRAGASQHSPL